MSLTGSITGPLAGSLVTSLLGGNEGGPSISLSAPDFGGSTYYVGVDDDNVVVTINNATDGASWGLVISSTGGGTDVTASGTVSGTTINIGPQDLTGLNAGTLTFAYSEAGEQVATAIRTLSPTAVPDAPTITDIAIGVTSATLTITPGSANGSAITDFVYEYNEDSGGWQIFGDGVSTDLTEEITGLSQGASVQFAVTAVNAIGSSVRSVIETRTIPAVVPGQITSLSLTSGDGQITVAHADPSDGGSAITDHQYQYSTDGTNFTLFSDGVSSTAGATITSLTNGQVYQIQARSVNAVGPGPWSSSFTATPAAAPSGIPWTPSMIANGAEVHYDFNSAITTIDDGGITKVTQWNDQSANARHAVTQVSPNRAPTLNTLNGKNILTFENDANNSFDDSLDTPTGWFGTNGSVSLTILFVCRVRPDGSNSCLIGRSDNNFNRYVGVQADGSIIVLNQPADVIQPADLTERWLFFTHVQNPNPDTSGYDDFFEINGVRTSEFKSAAGGSSNGIIIGNSRGDSLATPSDFAAFAAFPGRLSDANIMRWFAYQAHELGIQAELPDYNIYKTAPPTVPVTVTDTSDWFEPDISTFNRQQTIITPGKVEIQQDTFLDNNAMVGPSNSVLPAHGALIDLTAAEWARMATEVMGLGEGLDIRLSISNHQLRGLSADGKRAIPRQIDLPNEGPAIAYEPASTQVDTGDGENEVEKLKAFADACPHTPKLFWECWTLPAAFKNNNSLNGVGDSFPNAPDAVTDPVAHEAWCQDVVDNNIASMRYYDDAGLEIIGVGFYNELGHSANVNYGFTSWGAGDITTAIRLVELTMEAIEAASWTNLNPSTLHYYFNNWDANGATGYAVDEAKASPIISARLDAWADHNITAYGNDANNVQYQTPANRTIGGRVLGVMQTEFEYFDGPRNTHIATYGPVVAEQFMFANTVLLHMNFYTMLNSPGECHIIHLAKPTYDSTGSHGFQMSVWKSPYDTSDNQEQDYSALPVGHFEIYDTNYNSVKMLTSIARNSVRLHWPNYEDMATSFRAMAWMTPANKLGIMVINRTGTSQTFKCSTFGRTLAGNSYSATTRDVSLGSESALIDQTIPAYGGQVWLEA